MSELTVQEAYLATFAFVEKRYSLTMSGDLASFLSDMSLMPDGSTADPALAEDWQEAVEAARSGSVNAAVQLRRR